MNGNNDITVLQNQMKNMIPQGNKRLIFFGIILATFLLIKSITVIPAGYVGLKDFFGNVSDDTLPAGLHLVNPLLNIHKMTVRTRNYRRSECPFQRRFKCSFGHFAFI
ncbi:MAG: hypothetical protein IPJ69_00085 [Deltaproteobacteria bacterium]|nr:MAG: hypothetical protein IPJ69_00085 [Deltaproteobacteria bacterium]